MFLLSNKCSYAQQVNNTSSIKEGKDSVARRSFSSEDLFALKQASDIQISPDGKYVAYVRSDHQGLNDATRQSIWIINISTREQHEWVNGGAYSPRWSPDSRKLAYLADDTLKTSQIFVKDLIGSFNYQLTNGLGSPANICWSPDGLSIAYMMFIPEHFPTIGKSLHKPTGSEWAKAPIIFTSLHVFSDGNGLVFPGYTHLFIVLVNQRNTRQITYGPFNDEGIPAWSPDSRYIYFSAKRRPGSELNIYSDEIFKVNISNGALTRIAVNPHAPGDVTVSPDGKMIAFTGLSDNKRDYELNKLYVMSINGSGCRQLGASLDRDIFQPRWTPDGRGIFFTYDNNGNTKIGRLTLDDHLATLATDLDGDAAFSVSKSGVIAFPLGSPDRPVDIAILSDESPLQKLTKLNELLLSGINLGKMLPLSVKSSLDGRSVGAWIVLPPNFKPLHKYPLILSIHGGPHGDDGLRWSSVAQLFAADGYITLTVNYRGSTSYGFSFANETYGKFPDLAYQDLISAVDAAVTKGCADPQRLFVTGGSAGGELTTWIVGKTGKFKAAAALKPVINVLDLSLTSDQFVADSKYTFNNKPWENPLYYWRHSPLSLVGHVNTPTLLMVGEDDHRTPFSEALQFYNALKLRQVPTAIVLVPGASHESLSSIPSQLGADVAIILGWFNRYDPKKNGQ